MDVGAFCGHCLFSQDGLRSSILCLLNQCRSSKLDGREPIPWPLFSFTRWLLNSYTLGGATPARLRPPVRVVHVGLAEAAGALDGHGEVLFCILIFFLTWSPGAGGGCWEAAGGHRPADGLAAGGWLPPGKATDIQSKTINRHLQQN